MKRSKIIIFVVVMAFTISLAVPAKSWSADTAGELGIVAVQNPQPQKGFFARIVEGITTTVAKFVAFLTGGIEKSAVIEGAITAPVVGGGMEPAVGEPGHPVVDAEKPSEKRAAATVTAAAVAAASPVVTAPVIKQDVLRYSEIVKVEDARVEDDRDTVAKVETPVRKEAQDLSGFQKPIEVSKQLPKIVDADPVKTGGETVQAGVGQQVNISGVVVQGVPNIPDAPKPRPVVRGKPAPVIEPAPAVESDDARTVVTAGGAVITGQETIRESDEMEHEEAAIGVRSGPVGVEQVKRFTFVGRTIVIETDRRTIVNPLDGREGVRCEVSEGVRLENIRSEIADAPMAPARTILQRGVLKSTGSFLTTRSGTGSSESRLEAAPETPVGIRTRATRTAESVCDDIRTIPDNFWVPVRDESETITFIWNDIEFKIPEDTLQIIKSGAAKRPATADEPSLLDTDAQNVLDVIASKTDDNTYKLFSTITDEANIDVTGQWTIVYPVIINEDGTDRKDRLEEGEDGRTAYVKWQLEPSAEVTVSIDKVPPGEVLKETFYVTIVATKEGDTLKGNVTLPFEEAKADEAGAAAIAGAVDVDTGKTTGIDLELEYGQSGGGNSVLTGSGCSMIMTPDDLDNNTVPWILFALAITFSCLAFYLLLKPSLKKERVNEQARRDIDRRR